MIGNAVKYVEEHRYLIEDLAANGHPLGRAIIKLHELHVNEPKNVTASNVLIMAVEQFKRDRFRKRIGEVL